MDTAQNIETWMPPPLSISIPSLTAGAGVEPGPSLMLEYSFTELAPQSSFHLKTGS